MNKPMNKKDDDIFLLSVEEYGKYQKIIPSIRSWWWLRTCGIDRSSVMTVFDDSSINFGGLSVNRSYSAIRPAIIIEGDAKIGDRIIKYQFPWIVIGEHLAIAEVPIGFEKFDDKNIEYKDSYIRDWLLDWKKNRS